MSGKLPVGLAETGPAATKTSNIANPPVFGNFVRQLLANMPTNFVALRNTFQAILKGPRRRPNLQPQLRGATSQVVASPSVACRASHLGRHGGAMATGATEATEAPTHHGFVARSLVTQKDTRLKHAT